MLLLLLACARQASPLGPEGPVTSEEVRGAAAASSASAPRTVGELGNHAFLRPIDAPATVGLVAGGEIPTRASACGSCHKDHYAEWRGSTHASAVHDLQYLAELAKPDQPRWLCLNCHAPTVQQRAERITPDTPLRDGIRALAATSNPEFDATRVGDGVGCAACHVRRDADGVGTIVGPRGSGRAPHRVRADAAALTDVCVRCHSPGPAALSATFTCWFETAEEVAAGPSAGTSCTECHMPATERPAATGTPAVELRRHLWDGGGVPKTYAGYDALLARGWRTGLDVRVSADPPRVELTNARAGHDIPTGDPERHLRVEARYEAKDGTVLARDVKRIGQTWDFGDEATGRAARRLADDRLEPGETFAWSPAPAPAGATRLVVEVAHVRLSPENARFSAGATLDAELEALWPGAEAQLPALDQHYPLATYVWRTTVPLDGSPATVAMPTELVAASKALGPLSLDEKAARLSVP